METVLRTLAFTLSEMGCHERFFSRRVTWFHLCFKIITLAVCRDRCGEVENVKAEAERSISHGSYSGKRWRDYN